jgi:hypothetical protein
VADTPPLKAARLLRLAVVLIALHSYGVGLALILVTGWGTRFGGFGEVTPLFFARQAGVFHLVVATGYLIEYFRYRGVLLLLFAKSCAVVFLTAYWLAAPGAWAVPLSALGDAAMGLAVAVLWRAGRAQPASGAFSG